MALARVTSAVEAGSSSDPSCVRPLGRGGAGGARARYGALAAARALATLPAGAVGVDYSFARPGGAALAAARKAFAMRYLSPPPNGKNITSDERDDLLENGILIGLVWESGSTRVLGGSAAGAADAAQARSLADQVGAPETLPLAAAAAVLGSGRVGLYGGYWPLSRAFSAGAVAWGWQTYAWSGGNVDPRAHLYQGLDDTTVAGAAVDLDQTLRDDLPFWASGADPASANGLGRGEPHKKETRNHV